MSDQPYMPQSKSDTHLTPDNIFEIIESEWQYKKSEMFDPCPENYKVDGTLIDWQDINFVNPPYARPPGEKMTMLNRFVLKAVSETFCGRKSIMLLPAKTDQSWFHLLVKNNYQIIWLKGRLKFKNNKYSATQPHFLVYVK